MIIVIFGRSIQFLLALLTMRLATTLLNPGEIGKISLVTATTTFFALFFINPVGMFINRRMHTWHSDGIAKFYLSKYLGYILVVALISALGLFLATFMGLLEFGIPIYWLITLICGSLVFNTINQTSIPLLNLLGNHKAFIALSIATITCSCIFAVYFAYQFEFSAQHWLLGLLVGQIIFAIIGTKVLLRKLESRNQKHCIQTAFMKKIGNLFHFAWPVAIYAGLAWVQSQGYRYFMEEYLSLADLGLFVAGYSISAGVIAAFESIVTTYFQPKLYRDISIAASRNEEGAAWHGYAKMIMPSTVLTAAMVVVFAPEIAGLLLGPNFQSAANFILWGALSELLRVLVGVYILIAHVRMKTRLLIFPGLIGAIVSVIFCFILIPKFGAHGAGLSLVISAFVTIFVLHRLLINETGSNLSWQPILVSLLFGFLILIIELIYRNLLDSHNWISTILYLVIVGSLYLIMQYYLLGKYLPKQDFI